MGVKVSCSGSPVAGWVAVVEGGGWRDLFGNVRPRVGSVPHGFGSECVECKCSIRVHLRNGSHLLEVQFKHCFELRR